ncbi:hypothetical protein SAY87_017596 [Trapa incisa]|uniref:Uncharacterized protein n=1 Tax=Trapa incisa TaxID=236973 RepID=A0AAN7QS11_9MYRT|nr:hypothetical protein SAY87_017596 [Trapa incisa]
MTDRQDSSGREYVPCPKGERQRWRRYLVLVPTTDDLVRARRFSAAAASGLIEDHSFMPVWWAGERRKWAGLRRPVPRLARPHCPSCTVCPEIFASETWQIQAAFRTDEIRRTPPIPQDEMRAGMSYLHETIWKGVPKFLRRVDTALKSIGINERVQYNAPNN